MAHRLAFRIHIRRIRLPCDIRSPRIHPTHGPGVIHSKHLRHIVPGPPPAGHLDPRDTGDETKRRITACRLPHDTINRLHHLCMLKRTESLNRTVIPASLPDTFRPVRRNFAVRLADIFCESTAAPVAHAALPGEHHRLPVGPAAVRAIHKSLDVRNRVGAEEIRAFVYRHRTRRPCNPCGEPALGIDTCCDKAVLLRHMSCHTDLISVTEILSRRRNAPHPKGTPQTIRLLRPLCRHPCHTGVRNDMRHPFHCLPVKMVQHVTGHDAGAETLGLLGLDRINYEIPQLF